MLKKKYFVILLTLLLTLLLGCFTSCYAHELGEIKNLVYNILVNNRGFTDTSADALITSKTEEFNNISPYCNDSYGILAIKNSSDFYIYFWPYSDTRKFAYVSSSYGWLINRKGYLRITSNDILGRYNYSNTAERAGNNASFIYTDFNIYKNTSGSDANIVVWSSGTITPSWFNLEGRYYNPDRWEFTRNGTLSTIYGSQWPYSVLQASNDTNFGSVIDSMHVQQIRWRYASYNTSLQDFGNYSSWYYLYDYNGNGNIALFWPSYSTQVSGKWQTSIHMSTANYQNCIIQLEIISSNPSVWSTLGYTYYIKNRDTFISGDIIFPLLTFSGDYNNDYNNQINNNINQENVDNTINSIDNINNTINDDSQVDALLNDFVSGDLATNLGYNPFSNPYHDFLYSFLSGIVDVLCSEQNETLDISFMGRTIILHSEDFTTDANNPIIVFVRIILIFFFIYFTFKFFYSIYVGFEIADIETLKQKLGTDEFYYKDGKYM